MLRNTDFKPRIFVRSGDVAASEAILQIIAKSGWPIVNRLERKDDFAVLSKLRNLNEPLPVSDGVLITRIDEIKATDLPRAFVGKVTLSSLESCLKYSAKADVYFSSELTFDQLPIWLALIFSGQKIRCRVGIGSVLKPENTATLNRFLSTAKYPVSIVETAGNYRLEHAQGGSEEMDNRGGRALMFFDLPGIRLEEAVERYVQLLSNQNDSSKDARWYVKYPRDQVHDPAKELKEVASFGLPRKKLEVLVSWRLKEFENLKPLPEMARLKGIDASVPLILLKTPESKECQIDIACSAKGKCRFAFSVDDPADIKPVEKLLGVRLKPLEF